MDFDETRLYYSHQALRRDNADGDGAAEAADDDNDDVVQTSAVRRHFREFLRNYRQGQNRFIYRDKLNRMHRRSLDKMEVDLQHLGEYDPEMLGLLRNAPATYLPAMELAAMDALKTLLYEQQQQASADDPANEDDEDPTQTGEEAQQQAPHDPTLDLANTKIQLLLRGNLASTPLRKIKSEHMNKLLKCPGIVISTSPVKSRATQLLIRCHRCLHEQQMGVLGGPYAGATLPRRCSGADPGQCGPFPYAVVPDLSDFVDRQSWKLQESPETVPTGEMPRSVMLAVERSLVDKAPPGTRVQVLCIPTLFQTGKDSVKSVYLQVVGLDLQNAPGDSVVFTPHEEAAFSALSKHSDVYAILSRSMAPSISGSYTHDIKKAMLCMLMGGTRKKLPDGVKLRGDINVLMLGDPSTAKSQFLKFASRVAPVGIYTSGKGSSAAGLTASVVKDAKGEFYLEGGAMVLADGGIVCIDEFDKMRPQDRVAIHEAMEQQTISIAKAGITTVLNSRSSVLAAANPVFGRYDELKSASENIDLMTTILSRFDLIFLVRDVREEERDRMICEHVMGVHMQHSGSGAPQRNSIFDSENDQQLMHNQEASADAIADHIKKVAETGEGELSVPALKKYIQYCKAKCTPRLSETSGDQLVSNYVRIRNEVRKRNIETSARMGEDTQATIPITVRQLEALVRLSESLAKMRLDTEVQLEDIQEALRLFTVSTMAANSVDSKEGGGGSMFGSNPSQMEYTESFLNARLNKGTMVNRQRLLEEAASQGHNAVLVAQAIHAMVGRGDLQERNQGRLIKRVR